MSLIRILVRWSGNQEVVTFRDLRLNLNPGDAAAPPDQTQACVLENRRDEQDGIKNGAPVTFKMAAAPFFFPWLPCSDNTKATC